MKSETNMTIEQMADELGYLREQLKVTEEMFKAAVEDQIPDDGPLKIKGEAICATVSKRTTVSFPDKVVEAFWEKVGHGKAKNFFKRETKVVYKKITDAVKALLENSQSDGDLQEGKKILKKGMKTSQSIAIKTEPVKKED